MTYMGRQGHLVTITSSDENAFVINLAAGNSYWMAGSDAQQEGVWRWVAGPENGQIISPTFWAPGQPDNSGNEDALCHWTVVKGWNDAPTSSILMILVEFECPANPSATGYCSRKSHTTCVQCRTNMMLFTFIGSNLVQRSLLPLERLLVISDCRDSSRQLIVQGTARPPGHHRKPGRANVPQGQLRELCILDCSL
jgi:hypothetical protein